MPFDPKKSYKVISRNPDIGADMSSPAAMGEFAETAASAMDIPGSIVRSGVKGAFTEGETAVGEAGEQIQRMKQYGTRGVQGAPTGKQVLESMGREDPSFVEGMAAEIVTDPMGLIPVQRAKPLLKVARQLKRKSGSQAGKALSKYITTAKYTKEAVDPKVLGMRLVEEDLVPLLNKPTALKERIIGKSVPILTGDTLTTIRPSKKSSGLIEEISNDLADHMSDISKTLPPDTKKIITTPVSVRRAEELMDPLSGTPFDPKEIQQAEQLIQRIMYKGTGVDPTIDRFITLKDAFKIKKNLNSRISSQSFYAPLDRSVSLEKEVMVDLSKQLDEYIRERLKGIEINAPEGKFDASDYYDTQNNRLHHLYQIKGALESVDLKDLKSMDMTQFLTELAISGGVGAGIGASYGGGMLQGAAMGAGVSTMRRTGHAAMEAGPEFAAKAINAAGDNLPYLPKAMPQAMRSMVLDPQEMPVKQNRSPQSIGLQNNLPMQVIDAKLPRDIDGIMENKDLLLAKIAQMRPDEFEDWKVRLERPEEVSRMLPAIIQMFPQAFEFDSYQRINHVVPQPMRVQAMQDIDLDDQLSTTDKIKKIDLLNRTGELYDSMEEYQ